MPVLREYWMTSDDYKLTRESADEPRNDENLCLTIDLLFSYC